METAFHTNSLFLILHIIIYNNRIKNYVCVITSKIVFIKIFNNLIIGFKIQLFNNFWKCKVM